MVAFTFEFGLYILAVVRYGWMAARGEGRVISKSYVRDSSLFKHSSSLGVRDNMR